MVLKMETQYRNLLVLRQYTRKGEISVARNLILKHPETLKYPVSKNLQGVDSLLWLAMTKGVEEMVELFIEFGANINKWFKVKHFKEKLTFFHYMAMSDDSQTHLNVAQVLIKHGADLNIRNNAISTPIETAASRGNLKCVEFFVKNGVKVDDPESILKTLSLKNKRVFGKILSLLLQSHSLDLEYKNKDGENLIHFVLSLCQQNYQNVIKVASVLLDHGVPVDETNEPGFTPLHRAIVKGYFRFASLLLRKGADVNKMSQKCLPLSLAVQNYKMEIVDLLLKNGADINARDEIGSTVLHKACKSGGSSMIGFLLMKGADINAVDSNGLIPFSQSMDCIADQAIKEIAKRKFDNNSFVCDLNMTLINKNSKFRKFFDRCMKELGELKSIEFYPPYSYYSVLMMSTRIKKLSKLAKNEEFITAFEKNLRDFAYKSELRMIMDEALKFRDEQSILDSRLKSIFGDFLSEVVLTKIAENLSADDLPLK